jgi:hypothetical protein
MKTYTINNVTISEEELKNLIKQNPELKEEKKSGKRWRAEESCLYYYIDIYGDVESITEYGDAIDNYRYNTGNYSQTKEQAEAHRDRLLAIQKVTDAINELNEGWTPDWSDSSEEKYYMSYSHNENWFDTYVYYFVQVSHLLPFAKSKEILEQIIKDYEPELKIIFGVK